MRPWDVAKCKLLPVDLTFAGDSPGRSGRHMRHWQMLTSQVLRFRLRAFSALDPATLSASAASAAFRRFAAAFAAFDAVVLSQAVPIWRCRRFIALLHGVSGLKTFRAYVYSIVVLSAQHPACVCARPAVVTPTNGCARPVVRIVSVNHIVDLCPSSSNVVSSPACPP